MSKDGFFKICLRFFNTSEEKSKANENQSNLFQNLSQEAQFSGMKKLFIIEIVEEKFLQSGDLKTFHTPTRSSFASWCCESSLKNVWPMVETWLKAIHIKLAVHNGASFHGPAWDKLLKNTVKLELLSHLHIGFEVQMWTEEFHNFKKVIYVSEYLSVRILLNPFYSFGEVVQSCVNHTENVHCFSQC